MKKIDINNIGNPYAILEKQTDYGRINDVVLNSLSKKAEKPLFDVITQGDPVFGLNDLAITGLSAMWKKQARDRCSDILRKMIVFYAGKDEKRILEGISTVLILCVPIVGNVTFNWYKQLQNPIRGSVVTKFIRNVPKAIRENKSWATCVGEDILREQNKTNNYFFEEIGRTIIVFLSYTCYGSSTNLEYVTDMIIKSGYRWFENPPLDGYSIGDFFDFLFKYIVPFSVFADKTYASGIYNANKTIEILKDTYNDLQLDKHLDFLKRKGRPLIQAFEQFDGYPFPK